MLSLLILALGATGVLLPPQLSRVGGLPAGGAAARPGVTGAAPASSGAPSEYDMFAGPTIAALPAPMTAREAGWPLPGYCRSALDRHPGDPQLAAMFLLVPQKYYKGTISGAHLVADGRLGADADPGTPPVVAHRTECLTRLWSVVATVYPPYALKIVKGLVVFVPTVDEAHPVEYVGYVSPEDAGYLDWTLGVAASTLDDQALAFTLVHELGHLLSLAVSQRDIQRETYDCPTLPAPDGCLNDHALLTSYLATAWDQQTYRSWLTLWSKESDAKRAPTDAERHTWFQAHRSEFVDEYASTNPREDFAESFAAWCLDVPVGPGARGKLRFFDGRPELVAMKQRCAALA